jgi:hypothetical protein
MKVARQPYENSHFCCYSPPRGLSHNNYTSAVFGKHYVGPPTYLRAHTSSSQCSILGTQNGSPAGPQPANSARKCAVFYSRHQPRYHRPGRDGAAAALFLEGIHKAVVTQFKRTRGEKYEANVPSLRAPSHGGSANSNRGHHMQIVADTLAVLFIGFLASTLLTAVCVPFLAVYLALFN